MTAAMSSARRRRRGLVLLSAVVGLVLSACSTGPSQVNAAAIVGDKTITVDQVQELTRKAVEAEPAAKVLADQRKLDLLSRAVLKQLVTHELLETYARDNGITVDSGQVGQLSRQLSESLQPLPTDGSVTADIIVQQAVNKVIDPTVLAKDYLLQLKLGQQAAPTLEVTMDYIVLAPGGPEEPTGSLRGKAEDLAKRLAAGPEQAAAVFQEEIQAGGQAMTAQKFTPSADPSIAGTLIYGTPVGNVIGFQPSAEQALWVVAVVTGRSTDAEPDPSAAQDPRLATALGPRLLQPLVDQVGVTISPRYGVWDIGAMGVAPSAAETAGFVVPMAEGAAKP
ncbi:SurA N-terminal domain-containing protein [Actinokineospora guangxiensis]|uniref:SurA N-terminal domain-containing protein n=1 Tax=Actinokineospora guangxiensis TaxID=1490288 RepID=A0ABW0EMK3_9PSEU